MFSGMKSGNEGTCIGVQGQSTYQDEFEDSANHLNTRELSLSTHAVPHEHHELIAAIIVQEVLRDVLTESS
jgi:hypothetical protein